MRLARKFLCLVLATLFVAGLTACGSKSQYKKSSTTYMDAFDTVLEIMGYCKTQKEFDAWAEKAHQRGVQIVLFTDQWLSPIARFARHVIAGRTAVPSPWDSSAALFVVTEMVIAAVTRQLEQDGSRRLREIESLR